MCLLLWGDGVCCSDDHSLEFEELVLIDSVTCSKAAPTVHSLTPSHRWKCNWNRNCQEGPKAKEEALVQNHRAECKQPQCLQRGSKVRGEEVCARCGLWLIQNLRGGTVLLRACSGLRVVKRSAGLSALSSFSFSVKTEEGRSLFSPIFRMIEYKEMANYWENQLIKTCIFFCSACSRGDDS